MAIIIANHKQSSNFIDSNDNFIGYDMRRQCCEEFGYIVKTSHNNYSSQSIVLDDELQLHIESELEGDFLPHRILDEWCDKLNGTLDVHLVDCVGKPSGNIITLYNYHHGYYAHGIEYKFLEESYKTSL